MGKLLPIVLSILVILSMTSFNVPTANAWTPVEGHITQNTTWNSANSPYRAISDVTVDAGVLLTIEPGVIVQFADGFSLVINGSMHSVGTENNKIRFTSSRTNPSRGVWNEIKFTGGSTETLIMQHSFVEYAFCGIEHAGKGQITVAASEFLNNTLGCFFTEGQILLNGNRFESNSYAIEGNTGKTISNVSISSNYIVGDILFSWSGTHDFGVENTLILGNRVYGSIRLEATKSTTDLLIRGNHVQGGGIFLDHSGSVSIMDNIVLSGFKGISFTGVVSRLEILNNTLSGNGNGIILSDVWPGSDVAPINITYNLIHNNAQCGASIGLRYATDKLAYEVRCCNNTIAYNNIGVSISLPGKSFTSYNSIIENGVGVQIGGGYSWTTHLIENNDIMGNAQGLIFQGGAGGTVNATNNYWGDPSGPYHESVNPEGLGNSVNGNGVNPKFIPFLPREVDPVVPSIPELSSLSVVPLFMIVTLLVVILYRRKQMACRR